MRRFSPMLGGVQSSGEEAVDSERLLDLAFLTKAVAHVTAELERRAPKKMAPLFVETVQPLGPRIHVSLVEGGMPFFKEFRLLQDDAARDRGFARLLSISSSDPQGAPRDG